MPKVANGSSSLAPKIVHNQNEKEKGNEEGKTLKNFLAMFT